MNALGFIQENNLKSFFRVLWPNNILSRVDGVCANGFSSYFPDDESRSLLSKFLGTAYAIRRDDVLLSKISVVPCVVAGFLFAGSMLRARKVEILLSGACLIGIVGLVGTFVWKELYSHVQVVKQQWQDVHDCLMANWYHNQCLQMGAALLDQLPKPLDGSKKEQDLTEADNKKDLKERFDAMKTLWLQAGRSVPDASKADRVAYDFVLKKSS